MAKIIRMIEADEFISKRLQKHYPTLLKEIIDSTERSIKNNSNKIIVVLNEKTLGSSSYFGKNGLPNDLTMGLLEPIKELITDYMKIKGYRYIASTHDSVIIRVS
jgi:hypothetical protein